MGWRPWPKRIERWSRAKPRASWCDETILTAESARALNAQGQAPGVDNVPVTVETFIRAGSDLDFSAVALKVNGFGKFEHKRELSPIDNQNVIRQNRDTHSGEQLATAAFAISPEPALAGQGTAKASEISTAPFFATERPRPDGWLARRALPSLRSD